MVRFAVRRKGARERRRVNKRSIPEPASRESEWLPGKAANAALHQSDRRADGRSRKRSNDSAQVMMAAFFGLVGYALYKLDFEPAPLALGFVLGRLLEEKLRQALIISDGSPLTFLHSPLAATLLTIATLALVVAILPTMRKSREDVFKEA